MGSTPFGSDQRRDDHPHETTLTFEYGEDHHARIVERAITQELDEIADDRTRASVERDGATLEVWIGADDLVGLRAGLNTWLALLEVAERTANVGTRR